MTQDPAVVMLMSVGDITMDMTAGNGGVTVNSAVLIRSAAGEPVAGVVVSGRWGGLVKSADTATTDATGHALFSSRNVRKHGQVTFTVTGASKSGAVYNASLNVESSDSVVIP